MDLAAACIVSPRIEGGAHLRTWLYTLPADDRELLDRVLKDLCSTEPTGYDGFQYATGLAAVGVPLSRTLSFTTITVQQAMYYGRMLLEAEAAKKQEGQ